MSLVQATGGQAGASLRRARLTAGRAAWAPVLDTYKQLLQASIGAASGPIGLLSMGGASDAAKSTR